MPQCRNWKSYLIFWEHFPKSNFHAKVIEFELILFPLLDNKGWHYLIKLNSFAITIHLLEIISEKLKLKNGFSKAFFEKHLYFAQSVQHSSKQTVIGWGKCNSCVCRIFHFRPTNRKRILPYWGHCSMLLNENWRMSRLSYVP